MESFVHLLNGAMPRRSHADLDGPKDNEPGQRDKLNAAVGIATDRVVRHEFGVAR
jgi:hypothetical protein